MKSGINRTKSPMSSMFSAVFKREDIKVQQGRDYSNTLSTHNRSQSYSNEMTPVRKNFKSFESSMKTNQTEVYLNDSAYNEHSSNISVENLNTSHVSRGFEGTSDMKYQELLNRYDKMQEFYKGQVTRLTDEVNHYKTLYHKLLIQQTAEKKINRIYN